MELAVKSLDTILNIFAQNFWQVLIILLLLFRKRYWIYGLTLIMSYAFWGFKTWLFILIFVLVCISEFSYAHSE